MNRVTNFGSCAIDNVYQVPHFSGPGETLPALAYDVYPGGKGLNQSLALARAGASVCHGGRVGEDGRFLKALLDEAGVDTSALIVDSGTSGHAVIQVTPDGENSIVIFGGANQRVEAVDIERVLSDCQAGEYLLLQNEISRTPEIMQAAAACGLKVVFNAAPMTAAVFDYPLDLVALFIVNETEGSALTGKTTATEVLDEMTRRFPGAATVLTRGASGAVYASGDKRVEREGLAVEAVDTTGAGDTFIGYFLAALASGRSIDAGLEEACRAGALCVTRPGAASSIPKREEL